MRHMPRCDLQVHSSYSDKPSEWVLRQLGMPESYTSPEDLYKKLKSKGCDYVTITDHNTIQGCLDIAQYDDVFISEEVTTYFPEDGCKIHLLVWNITEAQHEDMTECRSNVYELAEYLRAKNIVHGVAHPLFSINNRLKVEHFEKMILLFKVFEGLNGTREPLGQEVAELCLKALTAEKIEQLAHKHKLQPTHDTPWVKSLTGGSDDHGGLYAGIAWTEVNQAASINDFLEQVQLSNCRPHGELGDALRFSNSIYNVVYSYASDRLKKTAPTSMELLGKVMQRFIDGENPTKLSLSERMGHVAEIIKTGKAFDFLKPAEEDTSLNRKIIDYFMDPKVSGDLDHIIATEPTPSRRTFRMASKIANDLFFRLFNSFLSRLNKGELVESLQPLTGFIPISIGVMPYIYSFYSLHGNRTMLENTAKELLPEIPQRLRNNKRGWFTDTLEDVNGVARTIRTMTLSARKQGADVTVVTSRSSLSIKDIPIMNFPPVGEFELPEYKLQKLSFPPILDMIDYIEKEKFTECIISTPGPVGLTALGAAKLLGLRTSGIYHTDFPQYVRILTEDNMMETLAWEFMHWFYAQLDLIYVNSEFYRQCWVERGIPEQKIKILPRGLDTELFNPKHRDNKYWKQKGAKGKVALYVGRVSKEKDLGFMVDFFREVKKQRQDITLAVIGDGPYRDEMMELLPDEIFSGIVTGQELGVAYASADLFLFPSTTDTFGNVVIEAMAAGLPTYVSDIGGPKELVGGHDCCKILAANQIEPWKNAVLDYLDHPVSRDTLDQMASTMQNERNWDGAFKRFWQDGLKHQLS
ncbi:MAG: glycosyltransferase [Verrucomicrobiota bacterium]